MKKSRLSTSFALFACLGFGACANQPTAQQQQTLKALATGATATAFQQTKQADRPVLAARLNRALTLISALENPTPENISQAVKGQAGDTLEYVLLASALAEYFGSFTAGKTVENTKPAIQSLVSGVKAVTDRYLPTP